MVRKMERFTNFGMGSRVSGYRNFGKCIIAPCYPCYSHTLYKKATSFEVVSFLKLTKFIYIKLKLRASCECITLRNIDSENL